MWNSHPPFTCKDTFWPRIVVCIAICKHVLRSLFWFVHRVVEFCTPSTTELNCPWKGSRRVTHGYLDTLRILEIHYLRIGILGQVLSADIHARIPDTGVYPCVTRGGEVLCGRSHGACWGVPLQRKKKRLKNTKNTKTQCVFGPVPKTHKNTQKHTKTQV